MGPAIFGSRAAHRRGPGVPGTLTENSDRRRRYAEFTLAALGLLAVVVCLPVIQSGTRWGFWDWDIFEAAIEVAR